MSSFGAAGRGDRPLRTDLLGDPEADAVIAPLGEGAWRLGALLARAPENDAALDERVPEPVADLVRRASTLAPDVDRRRLARAADFGARHLGLLTTALFCASLPRLYLGAKGALVLEATARMERDLDARVHETGSFVLDVWSLDGFAPHGRALRSAARVRVLHATVRAHLRRQPAFARSVPIHQDESFGTLCAFSLAALDGLRALEVPVDARDEADVWYLWRTVGRALGVLEIPATPEAARARLRALEAQHARPSEAGSRLASRLLERMEAWVPGPLPRKLVRAMLGASRAEMLGLPDAPAPSGRELALVRAVAANLGPSLLDHALRASLGGRSPDYAYRPQQPEAARRGPR